MAFGTIVHEAEAILREWLKHSGLHQGRRLPSERALAKQLGLQHYALNRAMARLITEGLVAREGYKLFYSTPKESPGTPFSCHLVISHRSIYLRAYRKVAKELGIALIVHRYEMLEEAVAILHQLDSSKTEGVIFDPPYSGTPYWEKATEQLANHDIPVICIGNPAKGTPSILADYPRALEMSLNHLKSLGHQELALMSLPPLTPTLAEILDAWKNLCKQNGFRTSAKRIQIPNNSITLREDISELSDRLQGEWNEVTGLVAYNGNEISVPLILEMLPSRKKSIPRDLSLICLRDSPMLRNSNPPVTVVESDISVVHETAFRMIQRLARKRDEPGLSYSACSVRVQPELILRGSTGPSPTSVLEKDGVPAVTAAIPGKTDPEKNPDIPELNLESVLRRPYPLVARVANSRFDQLNLERLVNRPLNFRRGWLGDLPLKHFDPGEHIIHGVPFRVLGGSHRSDCGAVVFQSSVNSRGNSQELPVRVEIPIHSKTKAIYLLHGCGYARFLKPFATYGFYQGKKQVDEVSLIPLGQPPTGFNPQSQSPEYAKANIQDWWPDLPHMDFAHARMAPINEGETSDHVQRHVYLYTLEWINPSPEKPIDFLKIEVDPTQSTTLGLLAISVLKP